MNRLLNRLFLPFLLTLTLTSVWAAPNARAALSLDEQNYRRAFDALDSRHPDRVAAFIRTGRDPVLNKVLKGYYMAQPGNDISFEEMAAFISDNPDWPGLRGILMIAEQKMPDSMSVTQVANWYTAHPPVTLIGFYRAINAFDALGQTDNVRNMIRARWTDGEFSTDELAAFSSRFQRFLNPDAHWARIDHLLWKNDVTGVRRMYVFASEGMKDTAEARMALANQARNADAAVSRVPNEWQSDPGLLYERLRWYVRNNDDDQALEILEHAPDQLGKAEAWWEQRQTMIRRMMDKRDYNRAYKLAAEHGQTDSKTLTQAEFLAGWLALRFLNRPDDARSHFQALYDNANTPISRARGAYWLGRTYEVLGDQNEAEQAYETAAALSITYYGELATTRIYPNPVIQAMPEPTVPAASRQAFYSRDIIRAIERLHALGEKDRARTFFHAALESAFQRADFALLTELAYQMNRPDLAIQAAKAANQKNMMMAAGGFPVLDRSLPSHPEPAFVHALIRQESMFNPNAESPAGAHGLMQLMPATAKGVAKSLGMKFKQSRLGDSDYNLRLGTTFIKDQLAIFNGSYVLALAGYNAGPHRVRGWMEQIGDPRDPNIDPIDWVEEIPVAETRNYVQRIIESLQIYRARLNGGKAPLLIINDLKR